MRILGVDPGFERLGLAVIEKNNGKEILLYSECFKTSPRLEFPARLGLVSVKIREIISKFKPKTLAVENLFLGVNHKTAMRVAEARGVILSEAERSGLRVLEASPSQIKSAVCGDGRADKKQIQKMVRLLLRNLEEKSSDDELDAVAIALTASALTKE